MAKKRKGSKKTSRRRRIGALNLSPSSPLIKIAAVGAGYLLAAKPVNEMLDKVTAGKVDSKIVGAGQAGIGAMLLLSKRPSMLKTIAGGIAAGSGAKRLVDAFKGTATPAVTGFRNVPAIGAFRNVPALSGYNPNASMNGYTPRSGTVGRVMGSVDGSSLIGN